MAGQITISGASAGEPAGQRVFGPTTITGTAVIGETFDQALVSGDNTFAVPTGAVAALIIPPALNTTAVKLRTSLNAADAGLPIYAGNWPTVYPFPSTPPTSLIVNAAGAITSAFTIAFI